MNRKSIQWLVPVLCDIAKPRNLVAKDLRTPKYRMRVVTSKKVYNRQIFKKGEYV
jgi:hypothetical protein